MSLLEPDLCHYDNEYDNNKHTHVVCEYDSVNDHWYFKWMSTSEEGLNYVMNDKLNTDKKFEDLKDNDLYVFEYKDKLYVNWLMERKGKLTIELEDSNRMFGKYTDDKPKTLSELREGLSQEKGVWLLWNTRCPLFIAVYSVKEAERRFKLTYGDDNEEGNFYFDYV